MTKMTQRLVSWSSEGVAVADDDMMMMEGSSSDKSLLRFDKIRMFPPMTCLSFQMTFDTVVFGLLVLFIIMFIVFVLCVKR